MAFQVHRPDTAPEKSRPILKELNERIGFLPNMLAIMAESPAALKGWVDLSRNYESASLSAAERKIIELTTSHLNACAYCIAAGTTVGEHEGVPRGLLEDLRNDRRLKDEKLEQLRQFTKAVMRRLGRPDKPDIDAFLRAGYTNAHVLEVVLGVTLSIMSNYVNHIIQPPLDKPFEPNRYEIRKAAPRKTDAA